MSEQAAQTRIEILAGKLSVRVVRHDIASQHGPIPCWSYVSEGLTGRQQTEVVFTLRRDLADSPDEFPGEPLPLFATIYQVTETGQRVTSGSFTEIGDGGFFGHHVLYVRALALPGVRLPSSCLAALLVTDDEIRAVREFGSTRVLARLGQATSCFPFPPWADPGRRGVALERTLEASVLSKLPRASAHDVHAAVHDGRITLGVARSEQLSWKERLSQVPEGTPLALLTALDPAADGCLVWVPGQKGPEAIRPMGSSGARVSGCFVALVPGQADGGRILEDGFAIELTAGSWQAVREALIEGKELELPATGDAMAVALTWHNEVYVSPIDVRAYQPAVAGDAGPVSRVTIGQVRLMASEEEVAARTSRQDLAAFLQTLQRSLQHILGDHDEEAELLLRLRCTPQGHDASLSGRGEIPQEVMAMVFETIKQLPRLPVRDGEVSIEIELAVSAAAGAAR